MADPKSFRRDLRRFMGKTRRALNVVVEEVGLATRQNIALRTPILTGRASGSWNAGLNVAIEETKGESYNNPSGAPFDGVQAVDGFALGDTIIISNSISYIMDLNNGSSLKAPAGFIEMAAIEWQFILPTAASRAKQRFRL